MKYFEKLRLLIGFTPNEGKIVFFLIGAFLVGGTLNLLGVSTEQPPQFDYSSIDSEFKSKANLLNASNDNGDSVHNETGNNSTHQSVKNLNDTIPVNINTATKEELMKLPGVGEAVAERIIMYREERGVFKSAKELLKVKGIGEKKFEALKPMIKIEK
ncbi:MAG: helix-hairpin-helix domain-containing protein [Ignavibacteriae bacterium]|nr:helix-hairpin-helix domain-containing protein [Ignavibacteriota bacterium]